MREVLKSALLVLKIYFNLANLLLLLGNTSLHSFTKPNENFSPWISLFVYIASISWARIPLNQIIELSKVSLG